MEFKDSRELFEDAKNKNKLNSTDLFSYTTLYDDWRGAKGNQRVKKERLADLRKLYKAVLYKK